MKAPITQKQLNANRLNAQKSSGPASARGKSISSLNSIKHGFLSKSILLPGESPERFLHLKNAYLRKFQPETQDEFDLIDTLVINRWRLLRNWTFESISLIHEQRRQAETGRPDFHLEDPATQAMLARRAMDTPPRSQEALSRHEVRLDRQYYRALDRLQRMLDNRVAKAEKAAQTEKSSVRTHEIAENKVLNIGDYPMEKPKEPHENPKENPFQPEDNPSEAA